METGEGNNGIVQHDFSGRASFSLFALLIKYKSVCSGATIGKTQRAEAEEPANYEKPQPDPTLVIPLPPLILRNSECDACGCGGDSVDRYMRKTSKNSRVEFGYNSPKPNRCLCLSVPLSVVLWVLFALCLHFKVVIPTLFPTICLSLSPPCLPSISLVPFAVYFFPLCRCGKLNLSSLINPGKYLLLSPNQVNKAVGRF